MKSLEEKYKDALNANKEDSYYTYISKNGIRANDKYHDTLAKADTERMLSSTDYGALAEKLSSSGLNGSGYEDYINSLSVKGYTEQLKKADERRQTDEYKNKKNYTDYLSDYEAVQLKISESLIKKIASGNNFSIEDAYAEAIEAGISKTLAYATAKAGVDKAKDTFKSKAIQHAKLNGLSAEEARSYALMLGLDEDSAKYVYDEISNLSDEEKEFYSKMSASEYYEYIKSQAKK